jgi:hypothetical protein
MTVEQLNLLGDQAQPADEQLGSMQREVIRFVRQHGTVSRDEVGAVIHAHRGRHTVDQTCQWCAVDAAPLLRALARRGLIERRRDGLVQLPDPKPQSGPGDLPEGF